MLTITVHGQPAPQGSKRAFAIRGKGGVPTGRVAVIESSHDRVKSWRQAVLEEARNALETSTCTCDYPDTGAGQVHRPFCGLLPPFTGPLAVVMVFCLPRPKGHYRTGRNDHLLRDSAPARPVKPPDTSKLVRATEDALTDAGVWADDAQVAELAAAKMYAGSSSEIWLGDQLYGLSVPGAIITVRQVTP